MADPDVTEGQAGAEPAGTTAIATDGQTQGQSVTSDQIAGNGTDQSGETFYDFDSIKDNPELVGIYKEMQRGLTKKSEVYKAGADKISQFDNFVANPVDTMRQLAAQHGYQMVQGQPQADDGKPKTYNNWDEVMEDAEARVMAKMQPMFGEMQNMKQQNVEQALDNSNPDWRTYETEMMATLQAHPTLVSNPDLLYRMSVPPEILEARANKAALAKIQGQTGNRVQGQSTTTQQPNKPGGKMTFDQAVAHAKQEVKRQGLSAPHG